MKQIVSLSLKRLLQNSIAVILRESAGSIIVDKPFIDSAVKPSASPRGEPQNDKFKAFRNRLLKAIFLLLFLSGCASTVPPCSPKGFSKDITYVMSTEKSKNKLSEDLRSGKLELKALLDDIREKYGDADDILVSDCNVRLIYRTDSQKNITLWFEDGQYLSMWSN